MYQPVLPVAAGPGREAFANGCLTCHSTRYIAMQPPLTAAKWEENVRKMMKTYGAHVAEEQAADAGQQPDREELLRRHLQDHGDWPKGLVVDLWGSATMRTAGEEFAMALQLAGVAPRCTMRSICLHERRIAWRTRLERPLASFSGVVERT